jgi:hypothetical protein
VEERDVGAQIKRKLVTTKRRPEQDVFDISRRLIFRCRIRHHQINHMYHEGAQLTFK